MRALQPECIGDYTIIRTLGTGSTGKVKLARHSQTDELVALKVIRKDLLNRKHNLCKKVRREIAVMKLLDANCIAAEKASHHQALNLPEPVAEPHIGLMRLLDVYDTESAYVLVLEYCAGGELFDILVRWGRLPEEQALDVFQQLVYALDFSHRRGICHRDLKPENVLLTADGRVKLADFGMASLHRPGSLLETSCGSPQYCAPEVILGESYVGCAADVWSLGVVLYTMTTGGLPFDDDNLHRLMGKITSGAFYMPEEVSPQLADVIQSMLTVDPNRRATIKDIKESDWFCSRPCRSDVYSEDVLDVLPASADQPITKPNTSILQYLKDLGLGDDLKILKQLRSESPCIERDFYLQLLQLDGDSLAFRHMEDSVDSPKHKKSENPTFVAADGAQISLPDHIIREKGVYDVMLPDAVQPTWVERIFVR